MSFPYYQSNIPAALTSTFGARAEEMARREVAERAGLLMRLGYGQAEVVSRIKAYLAWEYSEAGKPPVGADLESLVAGVFGRH